MSSDSSNSGIMQKADQIAFHFYTKLFYTVNQARATEESHSQGKIDKWFNLETPDSDLFTRDAREPYRNISLSPPPGPPPLEIQVLLCIPELTNNQVLIHRSDDSSGTTDPLSHQQQPSSSTAGGGPSPAPARSTSTQLRIEPTPRAILLETWTLTFVPHGSSSRLGDQALPTIYKHGIPLFRSLYSLLRVLPVWKLYRRLKRRTGGVNRNGNLAISLRVRPLEETDEALGILTFNESPSPSHPPLQTETQTFSPLPHPLGSLNLSATYLSSPNFEMDELESHLSSRFISLDLQGFVPTLSKHSAREEKEDGGGGGGGGVGPGIVGARSPPRAIVGATGGGRGGHAHAHGLSFGLGLPSAGESTSSISSIGKPVVTSINTTDNTSVAERFIIPSRVPSLSLGVTSSSSSSALIPPPRPQFTPLPLPLPFPTAGTITSPPSVPSLAASGLALHRMRRESSNSPSSTTPATATAGGSPSSELFPSSISPHRTSHSPHRTSHSPHRHSYQSSSLSSSPMSGVGIGAVPIRRSTAAGGGSGGGIGINPFKGNTLSSASASVSASGSSPSLSIRQGLSSGVVSGGGSPLPTGFAGSFSRIQPASPIATPSSLSDRKGLGIGERRISSESDRGEWDRDERERGGSGEGSRERDRLRRVSVGNNSILGGGGGVIEDAIGVPTRIPPTRKRYSSSFGNRYVGSVGSGGSGAAGGDSGGSTPASVTAEGTDGGGDGRGKEQSAAGGVASFLSTATDDDDISIFVQDIDARKPLSGRFKEREKRERDREREVERGRERGREEEGQDHDRQERMQEGGARHKGKQREDEFKLITSPVSWQRQRSPLSPRSPLSAPDREGGRQQRILSQSPPTTTGTVLSALASAEQMTTTSSTGGTAVAATIPETAAALVQSPLLSTSTSPPAPAQFSTSPNRGPMLTDPDEVDERLKRMKETFMKSLEGMGRGGSGGRRRDREKGKEKEKEIERDTTTRRGLSFLVSPTEGDVSSATNEGGGGPFVHTGTASEQQHPVPIPTPSFIPIPSSSPSSSTGTGSGSSSNQPTTTTTGLHPGLGLGLGGGRGGSGRGGGGFLGSTSTSTSASASSEAIGTSGVSQGSEEVIGRMDFYDDSLGVGRRGYRRF